MFGQDIFDASEPEPTGPEFAYIDESGDTGAVASEGSRTYAVSCLLVPMKSWTSALDGLIDYRRSIKRDFGVTMQTEMKAYHLVGIRKNFRDLGLSVADVRTIYERGMDALVPISSGAFSVVIYKSEIKKQSIDVFNTSWEYLFTRLRKRSERTGQPIIVVHDKGEEDRVRAHLRKFRRANWQGSGYGPANLLIEDTVARDSHQSYFIQAADLMAYAASRHAVPTTGKTTNVCDHTMWDRLKPIQLTEVSRTRDDGIYLWPAGK